MKNFIILLCFSFFFGNSFSQKPEILRPTSLVEGTLLVPNASTSSTLAIIIAGSGPTDRDGNQMMMKNNSLKFLATELYNKGISTFRYDKRIVKQMKMGTIDERKISFDSFIEDAVTILGKFKKDDRFEKIYLIGHSQGSLVAMIAAQEGAQGVISLAGAGQPIDNVVVDQLAQQAPGLKDNARAAFDELRANGKTTSYSPGLSSIFRPAIQSFMNSWMQYDPKIEIAKLEVPVLIVNGDKDLQVQVSEAELLRTAKPDAQYEIIENMNHILKEIKGDDLDNQKSYNEPGRKLIPSLAERLATFMLQ